MKQVNSTDYGLIIAITLLSFGIISIFIPFNLFDGLTFGKNVIHIGKYNELGDFINGVTSPFLSIAAFILLFLTYSSQKTELRLNRSILEKQNELINKQQFENTFFNLINLHNQIVNDIDTESIRRSAGFKETKEDRTIVKGRDCFMKFYEIFRIMHNQLSTKHASFKEPIYKNKLELIDAIYVEFFIERQSDLGHYFRNLYHIIKFVDNANINNKKEYTNLVRAQLSTGELLILYFNCLSRYGHEKFKPLIEKYSLLKNIANNSELKRYDCNDLYDPKAFS